HLVGIFSDTEEEMRRVGINIIRGSDEGLFQITFYNIVIGAMRYSGTDPKLEIFRKLTGPQLISKYLNGKFQTISEDMRKLCKVFGVTIEHGHQGLEFLLGLCKIGIPSEADFRAKPEKAEHPPVALDIGRHFGDALMLLTQSAQLSVPTIQNYPPLAQSATIGSAQNFVAICFEDALNELIKRQ
ncbi:hypothetical protein KA050_03640, partial [Candidatus Gracilibacteria bacterium]|nr:hypothetical protein [Candidatus Gracilibacteria bacterium]